MRDCVIIGSGRSGTSLLAGMLHASGYSLGDDLLPATPSNPRGYFESRQINNLNNELLASIIPVKPRRPIGYLYPSRLSAGQLWLADIAPDISLNATASQLARMQELIPVKPFCLKDPRFCYTLPLWHASLKCDMFLCVFREPGRTATSILKDAGDLPYRGLRITTVRAIQIWTSMYTRITTQHMHTGEWVFVHYRQLLEHSGIARIEDALGATIDASIVDQNLMRSSDSGALPSQTAQLYQRLCTLAEYV